MPSSLRLVMAASASRQAGRGWLSMLATRVGAVPDLIEDGVHGALAEPNDEAALAEALLRVLDAPAEERSRWGRAAREKAERGYGYDAWAAAHEELYARVLKG